MRITETQLRNIVKIALRENSEEEAATPESILQGLKKEIDEINTRIADNNANIKDLSEKIKILEPIVSNPEYAALKSMYEALLLKYRDDLQYHQDDNERIKSMLSDYIRQAKNWERRVRA